MNPPDNKYVKKMKDAYFPGVIITLKFRLNSAELLELDDEQE
jgi:hypothetical protein